MTELSFHDLNYPTLSMIGTGYFFREEGPDESLWMPNKRVDQAKLPCSAEIGWDRTPVEIIDSSLRLFGVRLREDKNDRSLFKSIRGVRTKVSFVERKVFQFNELKAYIRLVVAEDDLVDDEKMNILAALDKASTASELFDLYDFG